MSSDIIRLIRNAARRDGLTPTALSQLTGIPYSRAYAMLWDRCGQHSANLEKALDLLAPGIMAHIRIEADEAQEESKDVPVAWRRGKAKARGE